MEKQTGLARVTVTLDPIDVDLLDRLAALEGSNRSAELRSMLSQLRPMLEQTIVAFEAAVQSRDALSRAAAEATITELELIRENVEASQMQLLGALSKLEGAAAAADSDPRRSNHGGHTPTTPTEHA